MGRGDPTLGHVLFLLFTALSVTGTYLITSSLHSRRRALALSLAVLLFFVSLYLALEALLRWLGL
jgi:hypothetical protein